MVITNQISPTMSTCQISPTMSTCSSTEVFWQQRLPATASGLPDSNSLLAVLRRKLRSLTTRKSKARPVTHQPTIKVSRDKFDEALLDFELKLGRSLVRGDAQYLQEYALNFNTWRNTNRAMFQQEQVYDTADYDDVFSECSPPQFYAAVQDNYMEDDLASYESDQYSDVHDDQIEYADVLTARLNIDEDGEDYSDVYSEYSSISEEELPPPPLPRRLSDSRPPARPPVPSSRGSPVQPLLSRTLIY